MAGKRMHAWFLAVVFSTALAVPASRAPAGDNPLRVERQDAVYREVFTSRPLAREVTSWYHGFYLVHLPKEARRLYTKDLWAYEQENWIRESVESGIDGPFMPWCMNHLGVETIQRLYRDYRMKFPFYLHSGAHSKKALRNGAEFILDDVVACWDSAYTAEANISEVWWLEQYGESPWISSIMGRDEPLNHAAALRNPAVVNRVNEDLKREYGIRLSLSPGDMSVSWYEWPTDPRVLNADPRDAALLRIAVWRWLNGRLHDAAERELGVVRRYAPGKQYFAYNRNAINIRDVIDKPVRHSLDFLDQARIYDVTDGFSADPYPGVTLEREGRARALYHVGFTAKLVTDLAAGKPSKMILQAFEMPGLRPTAGNLREWAGQAAKAGVSHLEWYTQGNTRFSCPDLYAELLRLSSLWKNLPALDIPDSPEVAVIFSDDSRAGRNDAALHGFYTLHAILGEHLGAWFTFTGENQVRRGLQSLDSARLIIAPELEYVSRDFAELLEERVERGAVLVVLDPDALSWDIETGALERNRRRILGSPAGSAREARLLIPAKEGSRRFGNCENLPLQPAANGVIARTLRVPGGAKVLFTFEDGMPAVFSRKLGRGEVVVCAAMPFGNSELALAPSAWDTVFASLFDSLGIRRGLPIWRFEFPSSGGEVRSFAPVVEMDYHTMTGEHK